MPVITITRNTCRSLCFCLILLLGLVVWVQEISSKGSSEDSSTKSKNVIQADKYFLKVDHLLQQGKYIQAEELGKKVLRVYEKELGQDHIMVAYCQNTLGVVYGYQGKYQDAEQAHKRALAVRTKRLGADHPYTAESWDKLGSVYRDQGKYQEAEQAHIKALAIYENALGIDSPSTAVSWDNLGGVYYKQGKFSDAEQAFKKALTIREKKLGNNHPDTGGSWNNLGLSYGDQGKYQEAEQAYKKALAIKAKNLGADHPSIAASWNNLGIAYGKQGKYHDAEQAHKKALAINANKLGAYHQDTAISFENIGLIYKNQGKYHDAEQAHKKALAIYEKTLGNDHPNNAASWGNLGAVYIAQGKYLFAEKALEKALKIQEKKLGNDHPDTGGSWSNLGICYERQGKYQDAEHAQKKALAIFEKTLGNDHPSFAASWNNLATVYLKQGKYEDAERALKKALKIHEKTLGADHPSTAASWNNLGEVYRVQGKFSFAEQSHIKALATYEKTLGADHPSTALSWGSLGGTYYAQRKFSDAEQAVKKALKIQERKLGANHPSTAGSWSNLGVVYHVQGKFSDAEQAHKKALAIYEKTLGSDHPNTALSLTNLSMALFNKATQNNIESSLDLVRKATSIINNRFWETNSPTDDYSEEKTYRWIHATHLLALSVARRIAQSSETDSINESFIVSQRTQNSTVAKAISRMTARMVAGQGELHELVSRQQALVDQLVNAEKLMMEAYYKDDTVTAENHQSVKGKLGEKLAEIDARLAKDFPEYEEIANPRPLPLKDAQALLDADEALLAIIIEQDQSYLWAIRDDKAEWWNLPVKKKSIDEIVKTLRAALDLTTLANSSHLPDFPIEKARELHNLIIDPAVQMLKGAKRVFVVADGSLQSIPFGIMVDGGTEQHSYNKINWLAKQYAFAYLPSISSLKSLRILGSTRAAPDPFIGFGHPLLGNDNDGELRVASIFDSRGTGLADITFIRKLPSLPETADELYHLAATLNAPQKSVYLQKSATERILKSTDLSQTSVLAFATHGLLAGDFEFLGEPAIVMTPPDQATMDDDGLLTASEVTQLRLNADWVILSACNTAATDGTPGAEGFSGLTKAFFYAGAKTLLVSHWPVESNSAKKLTTSLFDNQKKNSKIGKAEALRQARLQMINDTQQQYHSHPAFWAPFVVVGEARTTH